MYTTVSYQVIVHIQERRSEFVLAGSTLSSELNHLAMRRFGEVKDAKHIRINSYCSGLRNGSSTHWARLDIVQPGHSFVEGEMLSILCIDTAEVAIQWLGCQRLGCEHTVVLLSAIAGYKKVSNTWEKRRRTGNRYYVDSNRTWSLAGRQRTKHASRCDGS